MRISRGWVSVITVLFSMATGSIALGQADHVRWDIISLAFTTPPTASAGGIAFASADATHTIRLTGSGAFVAPASGGTSGAATGGTAVRPSADSFATAPGIGAGGTPVAGVPPDVPPGEPSGASTGKPAPPLLVADAPSALGAAIRATAKTPARMRASRALLLPGVCERKP